MSQVQEAKNVARAYEIDELVGGTPLVHLERLGHRKDLQVFGKLESFNIGGSAKDRTATAMIDAAIEGGDVTARTTIVESSSGNLGIALARACLRRGIKFHCVVDARTNEAPIVTMRALGASVHVVREPDPDTGDLLVARRKMVQQLLAALPGAITLDQYSNPANPRAHRDGTMAEIDEALSGDVDYILVATSTAGTISGCQDFLDEHRRQTRIIAVDAWGSVLFGGQRAPRSIPGFGAGVVTPLSLRAEPDHIHRVSDLDCVLGARWMAMREGLLVGGSGGGVVYTFLALEQSFPSAARIALVFHDGGLPYLNTIYNDAWVETTLGFTPLDVRKALRAEDVDDPSDLPLP